MSRSSCQFSLGSVMLIIVWIAAGLGFLRAAPLLGGLYYLASWPAVWRTWRFTDRSKLAGERIGNWALVRTFLGSLGIVALLATASVTVVAGFLCVACLAVLVVTMKGSRLLARAFDRLAQGTSWLLRRSALSATRLAAIARRAFRRGAFWLMLPWSMLLLAMALVSVGATAALGGLLAAIVAVRIFADRVASARGPANRVRNRIAVWTAVFAAADGRLLRSYRLCA